MTTDTQIKKTTDYKQFKFLSGNRQINHAHVSRLKNSIQENNLTEYRPIVVNEKMQIIEGQHTFLACKELSYPIHYLTRTGGTIKDVQSLNTSTRNWSGPDYLYMYIQRGNKNYIALQEFMDRWRFNLWDCIRLLLNVGSSGATGHQFRNGDFIIADINIANKYAEMIYEFAPYTEHFRNRSFILACLRIFKLKGYKHAQMMAQLAEQEKKIPIHSDQKGYIRELDRIYNLGQKVKYSIYLEVRS